MSERSTRIVLQAASRVLSYPQPDLLEQVPLIESAIELTEHAQHFAPVLRHLREHDLVSAQSFHVQGFDLSRRHAMHLSYWTHGDTRQRGEVLASFKRVYRDSGLVVDLDGELPDHLPMVCEFAAIAPERGLPLLAEWRASLEMLRMGCTDDDLPHAGVLLALCSLLPGHALATRDEVRQMMASAQPVETVGLEPYGSSPTWLAGPTLTVGAKGR